MTPARVREEQRPGGRAAAAQRHAAGPAAGVFALQRSAGNRAVGMLLRQPTTTVGAPASTRQPVVTRIDRNRARVVMPDGRRYEVTRVRRPVVRTERRRIPPGVGFGRDDDRVFVRIDWCRDTRGEIQLGANVPEVVREAVQQIGQGIAAGQGADAIRRAVEDAEIKPSVQFEIARSGEWQIEGEIEISVEGSGVTGGGGELTVRRGEWDLALDVRNQDGSTTVGLNVRWTPGRSNRRFTCPTREHVFLGQETSFVARQETYIPPRTEQRTRQVQRQQEVTRYVYFDYATARIDERRSAQELAELRANLADGYRVSLVEGFTSPEGSHAPANSGRWQGNTRLAQERATAALERAQRECSSADGCLAGGEAGGAAEPELYTVVRDGEDVEGRELQESAVEGFLTSEAEARHRTPEVIEALERARTPAERARIIYPLLRRAVVHLTRTVTETETYDVLVPGRTELGESAPAPPDVERAVIPHFQVQDVLR
jgi:hypothetical protein